MADTDWFPAVDLSQSHNEYVFEVDLPGLKPEEVKLDVDSDGLAISGERQTRRRPGTNYIRKERPSGFFIRHLPLPADAYGDILATFSNGVLEIRLQKECVNEVDGGTLETGPRDEVAQLLT